MLDNVARRYFYGCNGGLFAFHFNSKRLNFFSESRCDLSCERSDGERERETIRDVRGREAQCEKCL